MCQVTWLIVAAVLPRHWSNPPPPPPPPPPFHRLFSGSSEHLIQLNTIYSWYKRSNSIADPTFRLIIILQINGILKSTWVKSASNRQERWQVDRVAAQVDFKVNLKFRFKVEKIRHSAESLRVDRQIKFKLLAWKWFADFEKISSSTSTIKCTTFEVFL